MAGGPVLLIGCGRLGSAFVEGWLDHGPVAASDLLILTPSPKPAADRAAGLGATLNPGPADIARAGRVVLAVKPAAWRQALEPLAGDLHPRALIVSVMAGVRADDIAAVANRPVARVMPTTAVAQGRGVAALWAQGQHAAAAEALFAPLADVVPLAAEADLDAATAVAGSGPAFVFALIQAMAEAGRAEGLDAGAADRLARGALRSAAAQVEGQASLSDLIARIASPGGTTRAGLDAAPTIDAAAASAVSAAIARARALSGS